MSPWIPLPLIIPFCSLSMILSLAMSLALASKDTWKMRVPWDFPFLASGNFSAMCKEARAGLLTYAKLLARDNCQTWRRLSYTVQLCLSSQLIIAACGMKVETSPNCWSTQMWANSHLKTGELHNTWLLKEGRTAFYPGQLEYRAWPRLGDNDLIITYWHKITQKLCDSKQKSFYLLI